MVYSNPTVFIDLEGYAAVDFANGLASFVVNSNHSILKNTFAGLYFKQNYSAKEVRSAGGDVGQVVDDKGLLDSFNNRYEKSYSVDLSKFKMESHYERKTIKERAKEAALNYGTLGLYPGGKALGDTAGAYAAMFNKDFTQEFRDRAAFDAGAGTIPGILTLGLPYGLAKAGGSLTNSASMIRKRAPTPKPALISESVSGESVVAKRELGDLTNNEVKQIQKIVD